MKRGKNVSQAFGWGGPARNQFTKENERTGGRSRGDGGRGYHHNGRLVTGDERIGRGQVAGKKEGGTANPKRGKVKGVAADEHPKTI